MRTLERRQVMIGAAALAAGTLAGSSTRAASADFHAALGELLAGRHITSGELTLLTPDLAPDGNMVEVTIHAASPMTAEDHVRHITLLATRNPAALVARYHFTPLAGAASVTGRIRLSESQEVVAVAEYADGRLVEARRFVEVELGGCGAA